MSKLYSHDAATLFRVTEFFITLYTLLPMDHKIKVQVYGADNDKYIRTKKDKAARTKGLYWTSPYVVQAAIASTIKFGYQRNSQSSLSFILYCRIPNNMLAKEHVINLPELLALKDGLLVDYAWGIINDFSDKVDKVTNGLLDFSDKEPNQE